MDYRLQFIHCDKLFPTREDAIAYAKERLETANRICEDFKKAMEQDSALNR